MVTKFNNYFYLDGNITLDCVAIGNPPPFITWRKLRSPLTPTARSTAGSLHLFSVGMESEGKVKVVEYHLLIFSGDT